MIGIDLTHQVGEEPQRNLSLLQVHVPGQIQGEGLHFPKEVRLVVFVRSP